MGKKKKHQPKHKPTREKTATELLREANQAMSGRKFILAIDLFKQLLKRQDNPEWRQALAEAYKGRAQELFAQGMVKEAMTVLENLPTICRVELPKNLHFKILLGAGQFSEALKLYHDSLQSGQSLPAEEESLLAVMMLGQPEPAENAGAFTEFWQDRRRVLAAIHALAEGDDETCQEQLKQIGLRSAYRDFRLLLSGLSSHYRSEKEAALARLSRIPEHTPLHSVAQTLTKIISRSANDEWGKLLSNAGQVEAKRTLAFLGRSDIQSEFLDRCKEVIEREEFSTLSVALRHHSDWFQSARLQQFFLGMVSQDEGEASIKTYESLFKRLNEFQQLRLEAIEDERLKMFEEAADDWQDALGCFRQSRFPKGDYRRLAYALILRKISSLMLQAKNQAGAMDDFMPFGRNEWWDDDDDEEDSGVIEEADWIGPLQKSLEYDPQDADTYKQLAGHYYATGNKAKVKYWLGEMLRVFPDDVEALLGFANDAIARKAYKSALDTLAHLLKVDPINASARSQKSFIHLQKARKHIKEKKFHLARKELAEAEAMQDPQNRDGTLQIKWGLMEIMAGNVAEGNAKLNEGMALHGDHMGTRLVVEVEANRMKVDTPELEPVWKKLNEEIKQPATAQNAAEMAKVMLSYQLANVRESLVSSPLVQSYLLRAKGCRFDEAQLSVICDFLRKGTRDFTTLYHYSGMAVSMFPNQPRFVFSVAYAGSRGNVFQLKRGERDKLMKMSEVARQSGDTALAEEITKFLEPDDFFEARFEPDIRIPGLPPNMKMPNLPPELQRMARKLIEDLMNGPTEDDDEDPDFGDQRSSGTAKPSSKPNPSDKGKPFEDNPNQTKLF